MPERPRLAPLARLVYEPIVRAALLEDIGLGGDVTTAATVAFGTWAHGAIVAREAGRLAGVSIALCAFELLAPGVSAEAHASDGAEVRAGETLATLSCDARALLGAERTALNLLGHLCGIASATAAFVEACAGTHCRVTETRKTLPGLRALQKYAVRAGGGANHRFRLDDAILIKDNHVALAGGVTPALRAARASAGHLVKVEIEVDGLAQLDEVLAEGSADVVLLDNFSIADLHEAVRRTAGRVLLEASGGITLAVARDVARSGVDVLSVGALTHSVRALDVALDVAL